MNEWEAFEVDEDEFLALQPDEVAESLRTMRGMLVALVLAGAAWTAVAFAVLFVWVTVAR